MFAEVLYRSRSREYFVSVNDGGHYENDRYTRPGVQHGPYRFELDAFAAAERLVAAGEADEVLDEVGYPGLARGITPRD